MVSFFFSHPPGKGTLETWTSVPHLVWTSTGAEITTSNPRVRFYLKTKVQIKTFSRH